VTVSNSRLDARGRPAASAIISTSTNTTQAGNITFFGQVPASSVYDFINDEAMEIPLLPGDALTAIANVVNVQFNIAIRWRERAMEESELK
jgi:hypothetical protein